MTLLQYRNKSGNARQMLDASAELKRLLGDSVTLIMNDRADLCLAAGFNGVHVGQDDLSPESARKVIGPKLWLGVSTHNPEQVAEAPTKLRRTTLRSGRCLRRPAKAILIRWSGWTVCGKRGPDTHKPLVAIGGITRATAAL